MPTKTTLLATLTLSLIIAAPASAATGEGAQFLKAIDTDQALKGFTLSEAQQKAYRDEEAKTAACVAKARAAYKKSKKKAANKAMRSRWEHMLSFVTATSKEGQIFAAMEPQILTWADNLAALNLEDEDLAALTKNGPAFLRANLKMEKRFDSGWGCRLTNLMIKSKKPIMDKRGRPNKTGNLLVSKSMGMTDKQFLKDSQVIYDLADENTIGDGTLEDNFEASPEEISWYQDLLTRPLGLLDYVKVN